MLSSALFGIIADLELCTILLRSFVYLRPHIAHVLVPVGSVLQPAPHPALGSRIYKSEMHNPFPSFPPCVHYINRILLPHLPYTQLPFTPHEYDPFTGSAIHHTCLSYHITSWKDRLNADQIMDEKSMQELLAAHCLWVSEGLWEICGLAAS